MNRLFSSVVIMLSVNLSFAKPLTFQETLISANEGVKSAMYDLGVMYSNGWGVVENTEEAIRWFRQASAQGSFLARYELGLIYSNSDRINVSYMQAYVWWTLLQTDLVWWKNKKCRITFQETAVDDRLKMFEIPKWRYIGDTPFKWCSGGQESFTGKREYLTDKNDGTSKSRVFGWLKIKKDLEKLETKMSVTELAEAQFNVASAIYHGNGGVNQDFLMAYDWYRRSAQSGNAKAQYSLGLMNVKGHGMPRNQTQAFVWWFMSAGQGEKQALESLQTLSKSMTQEQIDQAQALAAKCWESKFQDCD